MPPFAICRSVSSTPERAARSPALLWCRKRTSRFIAWGNFGAPPKPPKRLSTWPTSAFAAWVRSSSETSVLGMEELVDRGHAAARDRREVGATVERGGVGGHEYRHRPATMAGHRLDGGHVDRVDVRALLAVHLDVDEVLVHDPGGRLVLERLALHDVAPVAGRVAYTEQYRP